ncbi:WXG100 family type VII secretion target [Arthrobacter monumenti]
MYTTGAGPLVCGPGYSYYLIEERLRGCATRVDELTGRIQSIQGIDWQSPAGQAFRQCLYEHRRTMTELHEQIAYAAVTLRRLADNVAAVAAAEASGAGG